ncbi:MAG: SufD family Fe-S cluster assembly protein [Desulfarculus sp.]|nr:SufD family Fe-S cluster assembly protein [Pseudomonadota bacterium]MBV1716644.1 SufD family Fe-S cluster assembly protein [Desulfarculus sp.]MBU4573742.1 SufD family Fe-S cluster assembly protein [Pseudomonadota bacterium]MBU4597053.1 SufD family Fe-S cluster assembly protein [Pseudomonadota bacterium]MBV1739320.1 SufD family Fe-S cluster assembly protein [Desulfarculus sp.]
MADSKELRQRAEAARDKVAAIGADLDMSQYEHQAETHQALAEDELCTMPAVDQQNLLLSGVDVSGKDRGGTFIMKDASPLHCSSHQDGVEVLPLKKALEVHPWLWDYYWKLVDVDADKYTAAAELDLHDGYMIRALPGAKAIHPIQACLYMDQDNIQQNVHNIIIAEEGAELHIISGCATGPHLTKGLHVGVSEFFIKKNAKLSFTMIHNWSEGVAVRPRSVATVDEGGLYLSNYVCMRPVNNLQMYPTCHLNGPNAVGRFYSILVGSPTTDIDAGGRVILNHPGCRAEVVSRAITNGGKIMARGHLVGKAPGIKAHLECRGLILGGGAMLAAPYLDGFVDGVEMSHEAAVGKIAQDEINYLMARGLSEDEATATIVRGFLSVDIPGLPPQLQAEIDKAINATDEHAM